MCIELDLSAGTLDVTKHPFMSPVPFASYWLYNKNMFMTIIIIIIIIISIMRNNKAVNEK
jgi:hypothetical protein